MVLAGSRSSGVFSRHHRATMDDAGQKRGGFHERCDSKVPKSLTGSPFFEVLAAVNSS